MWVYGSGFPKSHDVAKGIEKRRVEDIAPVRVVCRAIRAAMDAKGLRSADLVGYFGGCHSRLIDHWAARDTDSQPSLPTLEQWAILRAHLPALSSDLDGEVARLNARKGELGAAYLSRDVLGTVEAWQNRSNFALRTRDGIERAAAVTADGVAWQGWGTALKPAWEPIILARKPFKGTVAANVLRHGCGALNIDGCRIGDEVRHEAFNQLNANRNSFGKPGTAAARRGTHGAPKQYVGRWPANLVHDGSDEVVAAFPARAARFFYCAKANKADRAGSKHPTVKPVSLIRHLVRMVTPPGGVVLDCFAGSGTTGRACLAEGRDAVLVERETDYVTDIRNALAADRRRMVRAA